MSASFWIGEPFLTSNRPVELKYAREKSIRVSRSAVYVNVEMTRSTRFVVSSGSRTAVGAQTNDRRCSRPKAYRASHFAISMSMPEFLPRTSRYPKGGVSHLTPTISRFRLAISAGSLGRTAAFAAGFAGPVVATGRAEPTVAVTTATRATPTVDRMIRFIHQLLSQR